MSKRKTIVIFGMSSFMGSNLASYLKKNYRIIGTYYQCKVDIQNVITLKCDVSKREQVSFVINAFKPDITIYAVGLFSTVIAHHQARLADTLNTVGAINVAEVSERYQAKLIYLSSDQVFDGLNQVHHERDNVFPNTTVGKSKMAAEFFIGKSNLNYIILRCCSIYGRSINPFQKTWTEVIENNLAQEKSSYLDDCVVQGYLDPIYLAHIIKLCIENETKNRLLQVTSRDFMTRLEFAKLYYQYCAGSLDLLKKKNWSFPMLKNKSENFEYLYFKMNGENIEDSFNILMPTIEESIRFTFQKWGGEKVNFEKRSKGNTGLSYI